MNDTQSTALTLADVEAHSVEPQDADASKVGLVAILVLFLAFTWHSIEAWADDQERRFRRRQLRDAYRQRHRWKKADVPRLRALGVSPTAQRRMQRLVGRGRPVIRQPRELHEEIAGKFGAIGALINGSASSLERLQALKQWPWWQHHVEALYRGEHELARRLPVRSPSVEAEWRVGRELGISASQVHAICGEIRRMRNDDPESANFPAMTLTEFRKCLVSPEGFLPAKFTT